MVKIFRKNGDFVAMGLKKPDWLGLMFSNKLKDEIVVLDVRKSSSVFIHMLFVFHRIDVAFLDSRFKVIKVVKSLKPFVGVAKCSNAFYVLEGADLDFKVGERLKIK
ncbi:DUF192 domain-containing protein [archaeon]|nr:DUF192 domain-containing protein [archaeon]